MAVELLMEQTKSTKGTVVFTEYARDGAELTDERPHTFYILNDVFNALNRPENISVQIEAVETS